MEESFTLSFNVKGEHQQLPNICTVGGTAGKLGLHNFFLPEAEKMKVTVHPQKVCNLN